MYVDDFKIFPRFAFLDAQKVLFHDMSGISAHKDCHDFPIFSFSPIMLSKKVLLCHFCVLYEKLINTIYRTNPTQNLEFGVLDLSTLDGPDYTRLPKAHDSTPKCPRHQPCRYRYRLCFYLIPLLFPAKPMMTNVKYMSLYHTCCCHRWLSDEISQAWADYEMPSCDRKSVN